MKSAGCVDSDLGVRGKSYKIHTSVEFVYAAWNSSNCFLTLCLLLSSHPLALSLVSSCRGDVVPFEEDLWNKKKKNTVKNMDRTFFFASHKLVLLLPYLILLSLPLTSLPLSACYSFDFSALRLINTAEESFWIQGRSFQVSH